MNRIVIEKQLAEFKRLTNKGNLRNSVDMVPEIIKNLMTFIEMNALPAVLAGSTTASRTVTSEVVGDRKIFSIDVGDVSPEEAKAKLDDIKKNFENEKAKPKTAAKKPASKKPTTKKKAASSK